MWRVCLEARGEYQVLVSFIPATDVLIHLLAAVISVGNLFVSVLFHVADVFLAIPHVSSLRFHPPVLRIVQYGIGQSIAGARRSIRAGIRRRPLVAAVHPWDRVDVAVAHGIPVLEDVLPLLRTVTPLLLRLPNVLGVRQTVGHHDGPDGAGVAVVEAIEALRDRDVFGFRLLGGLVQPQDRGADQVRQPTEIARQ